jgi:cytoskeletal protein CcmA (bactofilin family)
MSNTLRPPTKLTVVEEGTEFKGTLTSSCPIDVRGRVEGELKTPELTVSATGAVHGRATVGQVRSQGEISGEFDADKVEISGVVRDNTVIRARSLDVKLVAARGKTQIIFGECELSVGDEPTESDHLEPPAAVASIAAAAMPSSIPTEAPAPVPVPVEAAMAPAAEMAASDANAEQSEAGDDAGSEVEAAEATGGEGKRKRRRKNGQDEPASGWSQPPSQPPPAS